MTVLRFLVPEQHLRLELDKLLPKAQGRRFQRYHLRVYQLSLPLLLILAFGVSMLFHVPHRVGLLHLSVSHHFVLVEAPVWQLPAAEFQGVLGRRVDQSYLEDADIFICLL